MYSISWKLYRKLQMKGWLTYSSIRRSRMMLRTLSDLTTGSPRISTTYTRQGLVRRGAIGQLPSTRPKRCHYGIPSSLRMYFSANDKLVSLRSTMRTLPKAPRPTTLNRRK